MAYRFVQKVSYLWKKRICTLSDLPMGLCASLSTFPELPWLLTKVFGSVKNFSSVL